MLRIERDIIVEPTALYFRNHVRLRFYLQFSCAHYLRKSGVHRAEVAPRVRDLARALLMFVRVTAKQQVLLAPASRIRVVDPALQNGALSIQSVL